MRSLRIGSACALAVAFFLTTILPSFAQVTGSIAGTVTSAGQPVSGAAVSLSGNNLKLRATTNAAGRFAFSALSVGDFRLEATKGDLTSTQSVELTSGSIEVTLALGSAREIGHVVAARSPVARGAGTNITLSGDALRRLPSAGNFTELFAQLPAAARGSNGQVHLNGDHGNIGYIVDGVPVPQALNRIVGNEFDAKNVQFAEVLESAYPAQYGEKLGAVINIGTRAASGPAGASAEFSGGSLGSIDSVLAYHLPLGRGSLLISSRLARNNWGIDPPVRTPLNDNSSTSTQFLRISLPLHGTDNLNFDLNRSYQTFQVPPDTANGQLATQSDSETQSDLFASLVYRHAGDHGVFSIGPSYKRSRIRDFGDRKNDFATADPTCGPPPATAPDPTIYNNPANCAISAATDRTSISYGLLADYALRSTNHEIRAGAAYRTETVAKLYAITLQPNNYLASDAYQIVDNSPNVAHVEGAYLQDTWHMGGAWVLDVGLRADSFQVSSPGFRVGYSQLSPRLKVTRLLGARASLYAYYGRFFVPFSFENISGGNAQLLNPASGTAFDLRPQRDSVYEIGAHVPLGSGDLGVRIMHKTVANWIDDAQVGTTNFHQDINFAQGAVDIQSALYQRAFGAGRTYVSLTHSRAVDRGCASTLLVDCGAFRNDWVNADHDQRWTATAGQYLPMKHGWLSWDGEYGSGLSLTSVCDACKVPPHLTFDVQAGVTIASHASLALGVDNLFNDGYAITLNNALQGTHYARPRTFALRLTLDGR